MGLGLMLACDNPGGCGPHGLFFKLSDSALVTVRTVTGILIIAGFLLIVVFPPGSPAGRIGWAVLGLGLLGGGGVLVQNQMNGF